MIHTGGETGIRCDKLKKNTPSNENNEAMEIRMKHLILGSLACGLLFGSIASAEEAATPPTPTVEKSSPTPVAPVAEQPASTAEAPAATPAAEAKTAAPAAATAEKPAVLTPAPATGQKDVVRPVMTEEEVTLTGKIAKVEHKRTVNGKEETMSMFTLTESSGQTYRLPPTKGESAIDLAAFVNKEVKLAGKGRVLKMGDKKRVMLRSITSVEEIAPKAAPAAAK
jgi:hypothetical protein